ncbi:MAG: hypothetical protein ACJ76X_10260 [Solirubrobacteraceae bacterium]
MSPGLPSELPALSDALSWFEASGSPEALDHAFLAAGVAIATLRGSRREDPSDATEARELLARLPGLERLAAAAVGEAERAAEIGAAQLWGWFGLASAPPRWNDDERAGARTLVVCACAPLHARGPVWLAPRLLRLAASRWAIVLTSELRDADEESWERALGERYASVRRRYAPRTKSGSRGLREAVRTDAQTREPLSGRLGRWLAEGADFAFLAAELEAAFVHSRTPGAVA